MQRGARFYSEVQGDASGARGLPKMAAPFAFDYLARLIIAPQPERANPAPRSVPLGAGLLCVAIRRPLRAGRGRRVSSFRWLPQNVAAPMPNCLDFGWRGRRLQKSGSLARTCGNGECPRNYPAPRVVVNALSPRPDHDRLLYFLPEAAG